MKKPIILMTVYRRYAQLKRNLERMRSELFQELSQIPPVVLIWAQPESQQESYIASLRVDHLIRRPKLPYEGEKGGVTYSESFNLFTGLKYIRDELKHEGYVIVQTADTFPYSGIYKMIDEVMQSHEVVQWDWPNPFTTGCNTTNFFGIGMDANYWPPVSDFRNPNTLEYQWLRYSTLPGIMRYTEDPNKVAFSHKHEEQEGEAL